MARFHSPFVYTLARENLRDIAQLTESMHGFGDLVHQMRRVGSRSSEHRRRCFIRQRSTIARYLTIARASANERQGQLGIVADLGELDLDHPIHDRCDHLGRALTKLLRTLTG